MDLPHGGATIPSVSFEVALLEDRLNSRARAQ